jgi:SAM-dependent methyltransferase
MANKFSMEKCPILNSKVYFNLEKKIESLKISASYKIRELYEDKEYENKLKFLFTYKLTSELLKNNISKFLDENYTKSDTEIYINLQKMIQKDDIKYILDKGANYIINLKNCIDLDNIDNHQKITCYLDFGCSDLEMITAIGENFKLDNSTHYIIQSDILALIPPTIPYNSEYFDLITIMMTLHHIDKKNLDHILDEIYRIMKPNGILIIREHDINPLIRLETHMMDVLHSFHEILNQKTIEENPILNYNTKEYWSNALIKRGFRVSEKNINNSSKNAFNNYNIAYEK